MFIFRKRKKRLVKPDSVLCLELAIKELARTKGFEGITETTFKPENVYMN